MNNIDKNVSNRLLAHSSNIYIDKYVDSLLKTAFEDKSFIYEYDSNSYSINIEFRENIEKNYIIERISEMLDISLPSDLISNKSELYPSFFNVLDMSNNRYKISL